ncbi:MAG TPA: MlaD family protein [Pyrinomonadaceae bacterium]|jgi:phospholipid/cholesterol/gamma-HCH transport system substrate-binding protein|nr:MlaD family protein [Pyrinomonadaceae bacterium]
MPRTQQKVTFAEVRVGIFMLVGLAVAGFVILNSSGNFSFFEKKMHLKARFLTADGLHSGADVQLAGVSIGKVEDVNFLPPDLPQGERIEATLNIVKTLDNKPISELIRTDSIAQLVATSVLGNDKMINITPGGAKGSPIEENAVLPSSAAVSLNQLTDTGNSLLTQINRLAVPANEILDKANRGEGTLGRLVNDEALYQSLDSTVNDIRGTMTRMQSTLDKVNRGDGSAGKLLNDPALYNNLNKSVEQLQAIATDIRSGRGSAGKFISDEQFYNETRSAVAELKISAQKISSIADDVKAITADLNAGRGSAGKLLRDDKLYDDTREAITHFNSTTTKLDAILTDAQAGRGTVGKLLKDETLYNNVSVSANNIATFTGQGTQLLDDFRKNPKKYLTIHFRIF